eukprot:1815663-Prymnesium_polylepis.1
MRTRLLFQETRGAGIGFIGRPSRAENANRMRLMSTEDGFAQFNDNVLCHQYHVKGTDLMVRNTGYP